MGGDHQLGGTGNLVKPCSFYSQNGRKRLRERRDRFLSNNLFIQRLNLGLFDLALRNILWRVADVVKRMPVIDLRVAVECSFAICFWHCVSGRTRWTTLVY